MLAGRLGPKQAMVLHFKEQAPARPKMPALTEITDAFALVGLYGPACASVMEKISSLDLTRPDQKAPYLLQGPVLGVPAKVIAIAPASGLQAFLVACARGYGQDLVAALLDAGEEFGLRPAGEDAFLNGIRVD
jgi:glycine cleavage system aminomethyltransferase T